MTYGQMSMLQGEVNDHPHANGEAKKGASNG